jgi:hypothetical protein
MKRTPPMMCREHARGALSRLAQRNASNQREDAEHQQVMPAIQAPAPSSVDVGVDQLRGCPPIRRSTPATKRKRPPRSAGDGRISPVGERCRTWDAASLARARGRGRPHSPARVECRCVGRRTTRRARAATTVGPSGRQLGGVGNDPRRRDLCRESLRAVALQWSGRVRWPQWMGPRAPGARVDEGHRGPGAVSHVRGPQAAAPSPRLGLARRAVSDPLRRRRHALDRRSGVRRRSRRACEPATTNADPLQVSVPARNVEAAAVVDGIDGADADSRWNL